MSNALSIDEDLAKLEEKLNSVAAEGFSVFDVDVEAGLKKLRRRRQRGSASTAAEKKRKLAKDGKKEYRRKKREDDEYETLLPNYIQELDQEARRAAETGDVGKIRQEHENVDNPNVAMYTIDGSLLSWYEKNKNNPDFDLDPVIMDDSVEMDDSIRKERVNTQHNATANDNIDDDFATKKALAGLMMENVVTVTDTHQEINCGFVVARGYRYGMRYNQKRFAAVVVRHRNPNATTMIFPTGVFTTTGAKEFADAVNATDKVIETIKAMRDERNVAIYADLSCKVIRVKNVVAKASFLYCINLEELAKLPFVRYEKQEFNGAIMELSKMSDDYANRHVTVLVFRTGAIVFTGTKGRSDVYKIYRDIFPHLVSCSITDPHRIRQLTTADQVRRANADLERANALPESSKAIIKLDIEEEKRNFRKYSRAKRSSQKAIEMPESQLPLSLQTKSTTGMVLGMGGMHSQPNQRSLARNMIALQSMNKHAQEKEQEKQKMLAALRGKGGGVKRLPKPKRIKIMSNEEARALIHEHD